MSTTPTTFCFEILADGDSVVFIRLAERVQSLGLHPISLTATWLEHDRLAIQFLWQDRDGARAETLARRIEQFVTVHSVRWREHSCEPIDVPVSAPT